MIIDAHMDIAYDAWALRRDFLLSAHEKRTIEAAANPDKKEDICTVGLPDLERGGVGLFFGSIFIEPATSSDARAGFTYHTPQEAHSQALDQLAFYDRLARDPRLVAIRSRADLDTLQRRRATHPTVGVLVEMEGSDGLLSPADVVWWWEHGVRQIGLAWAYGSRYCGGNRAPGPLKGEAAAILRAMDEAGMILDVSHLAEESFWQALDLFHGPIVASHSNCRALVPGERQLSDEMTMAIAERQLSDEMIKAIAERGGMIGVVLFNAFVKAGWTREHGKSAVTLADIVHHVDHIRQVTGNTRNIGIGSDLDGGFGSEATPAEIDTVADLRLLGPQLAAAGYSSAGVKGILGDNWLRFLRKTLPAA